MSSMDDSGGDHSIPRHFQNSVYMFAPQQEPYFSSFTEQEPYHHQVLGSPFVDLRPGLLTNPPGDQNYSINPVTAPTVLYQVPSLAPFYTTTPYASGSGGGHVDQIAYPAPPRAPSSTIPPQVSLSNDYTQAYSTTSGLLAHDSLERHNTQAYHGPSRQYHRQAVQGFFCSPMDMNTMQPRCVAPMLAHAPVDVVGIISPIRKTPVRVCPYQCPIPYCSSSFGRPQEQNRHILTHLPYWIHCPDPGCSWRGDRPSVFKLHWSRSHPSSSQEPGEDQYKTYDPMPLVEKIVGRTLSIQDAKKHAKSMVQQKASELGSKELYKNPLGRKERRAQRLC